LFWTVGLAFTSVEVSAPVLMISLVAVAPVTAWVPAMFLVAANGGVASGGQRIGADIPGLNEQDLASMRAHLSGRTDGAGDHSHYSAMFGTHGARGAQFTLPP
jgi:hypothetical protein